MEKSATVEKVLSILELSVVTSYLTQDGIEIDFYKFSRIIEAIREIDGYSEVRGHVSSKGLFNVSYSSNYLSYERLDSTIFINGNHISYDRDKVESFKVFVSDYNWIDLHINYNENLYATIVVVPKNN